MSWDAVIGQSRAKNILRSAIRRNRLAHAYLFVGPEGVGTDAAAVELARVVNCERRADEACGACASCRAVAEGRHPDVHFIVALPAGKGEKSGDDPLAKVSDEEVGIIREELSRKAANPYHTQEIPRATSIKINSVRHMRMEASRTLFGQGKRVFILFSAEMLSDEAGNALLKILEEPHEGTMLILTTAHPTQLLPTIVSRCQQIQFDPASAGEIAGALAGREHLPPEDAALIAELSAGSYGRAIELNGPAVADRRNDAVAFLRAALYKTNRELLDEIDRLQSAYERAGIIELLAILESWLRDAHFIAEGAAAMQSGLDRQTVEKFAAHHTVVSYDRVFDALASAISLLGKNVYISLVLITLALDLRKAIHPANL